MACGHPVMRRILAVARILRHIIQANGAFAVKYRREQRGRARLGKLRKGLFRRARQGVEAVRLGRLRIDHVVKECAEFRLRERRRRVRHFLDDRALIERTCDDHADLAQLPRDRGLFLRGGLKTRPLRDISGDLRRADDDASVVIKWRDSERNRDQRAVLSLTDGLVMSNGLALADSTQHEFFFAQANLRNDHADGSTDCLRRRIAEHPLSGGVPGQDRAIQVFADDGVV